MRIILFRFIPIIVLCFFKLTVHAQDYGDEGGDDGYSETYTGQTGNDGDPDDPDFGIGIYTPQVSDPGLSTHLPPPFDGESDTELVRVVNDDGTISTWMWSNGKWNENSFAYTPDYSPTNPAPDPTNYPNIQNGDKVTVTNSDGSVSYYTYWNGTFQQTGIPTSPYLIGIPMTHNSDGSYSLFFSDGSMITTNSDGTYTVSSNEGACAECTFDQAEKYVDPPSSPAGSFTGTPSQEDLQAYNRIMSLWGSGAHSPANLGINTPGQVDDEPVPGESDSDPDLAFYGDDYNPYNYQSQPLPTYQNMYNNFPKVMVGFSPEDMPSDQVYHLVGGDCLTFYNQQIAAHPTIAVNACALRLSRALNYSGVTIPNIPGVTYSGSDGKYYFLSAAKLYNFMNKTFSTSLTFTQAQGGPGGQNFEGLVGGHKGIYIMLAADPGKFGATGHATLYNGVTCIGGLNHCYFTAAGGVSRIKFWVLP